MKEKLRHSSKLQQIIIVCILLYAIPTLVLTALRMLFGETFEFLAVFSSFAHLLWIPAFLFIIPAIIWKRWWLVVLLLPMILLFGKSYAARFIPQTTGIPDNYQSLSILSHNLLYRNQNADAIVEIIAEADADIVLLQELTPLVARTIQQELPQYTYTSLFAQNSSVGQGVLSKYPIVEEAYWRINLGHQRVVIDIDGNPLTIFNTHPMHQFTGTFQFETARRSHEIKQILDRSLEDSGMVIVGGDFNMTDQSEDYQRMTQHYSDTYAEVGWGMGFTFADRGNAFPLLARIDYIFHSVELLAIDAKVIDTSGGSDHRPVLVTLAIPNA